MGFCNLAALKFKTLTSNNNVQLDKTLDILTNFRRDIKRELINSNHKNRLLEICDTIRDVELPNIGITLEDVSIDQSIWKLKKESKVEVKKPIINNSKKVKLTKDELKNLKSSDYFKVLFNGKFSKFDQNGFPTHDNNNIEISKNKKKKNLKMIQKHELIQVVDFKKLT